MVSILLFGIILALLELIRPCTMVKEGFSSDFIFANVFMARYTGEIIVNGVELYVNIVYDEHENRPESDFVSFEQAIKSCLKETEY